MGGSKSMCSWRGESIVCLIKIKLNSLYKHTIIDSLLKNNPTMIVKGDSAAKKHYWRLNDGHCLTNIKPSVLKQFTLPNASSITTSDQGQLKQSPKLS